MTVSPEDLRSAMRRWTTGVTIVSAAQGETLHGMTASSFTSLSLEPPYVMVSLERSTRTHDLVTRMRTFGVTILSAEQQEISNRFASPQTELGRRFEEVPYFTLKTGAPFIQDGLAFFDCRVVDVLDAGTHSVFVGEVVATATGPDDPPLVYYFQAYRSLAQDRK